MKRTTIIGIAGVAVLALVVTILQLTRGGASSSTDAGSRPNVVVILADDLTLESMRVMNQTRALLATQGSTFTHNYASFPNCCPSRATYLTGQFSHNNGVRDNVAPHGGFPALKTDQTLNVALQDAGYYTAHIGKFLNGWGAVGDITPPRGWSHWFGLIDPTTYRYFDYSVSVNGTMRNYGHAESDYSTDVLGAETVRTIGEASKSGKPFFVSFTPLAPHVENPEKSEVADTSYERPLTKPAPRHAGMFKDEALPKTPSFNEADVTMKPKYVRDMRPISADVEATETAAYRLELQTLQALDEWVAKIVQSLKDNGAYDNTLVVFTSDNGFYHGEHRIPNGKLYLYEPGTHIPLLLMGPGIPKGSVVEAPVGNVDLAATILAATGVTPKVTLDGRDMRPLTRDPTLGRGRGILLENTLGGTVLTEGVHTERFVYLENVDGTKELYDLDADPDQVHNLSGSPAYLAVEVDLVARLRVLRTCAGATCEGSDASKGVIPPPVAAPVADAGKVAASTVPPTPERLLLVEAEARSRRAKDALKGLFKPSPKELTCMDEAFTKHADVIDTKGQPLMQDPIATIAAIALMRPCITPERLGDGLGAYLPLLTGGKVAGDGATCVGKGLAGLPDDQFAAVLELLARPVVTNASAETRNKANAILGLCKYNPRSILP